MRERSAFVGCLVALLFASAASGVPIQNTAIVRFEAKPQNLWGPGNAPAFIGDGRVEQVGGIADGSRIDFILRGELGRVEGNVEGNVTVRHQDVVEKKGITTVDFMFDGIPNESKIKTRFGGRLKIDQLLRVNLPFPIPDINIQGNLFDFDIGLDTDNDFTYVTDMVTQSTGELEILKLGADIVVAGVEVNFRAEQKVFFSADAITGKLVATHLDTGLSRTDTFYGESDLWVQNQVLLDKKGYWLLTLEELELIDNSFWQRLGGVVSFEATTLFGKVLDLEAGFEVWESTPFALDFEEVAKLDGGFLVYVGSEPATMLLLGGGLVGYLALGRGRKPKTLE
ncbi:MAG: PEP-CTERM sorting domain-containing protein [Myxococcota bacterium]|nr:PEP-CTERM sorting domain-containing protein [Myxococcota bacterium]